MSEIIAFLAIVASATPLSLFIIKFVHKIFSPINPYLGHSTCICTETLQILTKENLSVKSLYLDNLKIETKDHSPLIQVINADTKEDFSTEKTFLQKNSSVQMIATVMHLCPYPKIARLEQNINIFLKLCGLGKDRTENNYEIIQKIPDQTEKRLSTTIAKRTESSEIFSFCKGNPKAILNRCTKIMIGDKKIEITPQLRHKFRKRVEKLNKSGQKVIAFAFKALPKKILKPYSPEFVENDLTLVGLIGLSSPLNFDIKPDLIKAKELGLKIYVLTRIKESRANGVAKELGIINENYFESFSGEDLKDIPDPKLKKLLENKEKDYVFAALKKEDKIRILNALKELGEVVAMTNHEEKNSFKTITDSIEKTRAYEKNHKKVVSHALICKAAEIILILTMLLFQTNLPLNLFQILFIDIFVNSLIEFSIRIDGLKSTGEKAKSFTIINALSMGIILSALYLFSLFRFGFTYGSTVGSEIYAKAGTVVFFALVFMQILSGINLRNLKKSFFKTSLRQNIYLILTAVISLMILYAISTIKVTKEFFSIVNLTGMEWQLIAFALVLVFIIEETRKFFIPKENVPQSEGNPKES